MNVTDEMVERACQAHDPMYATCGNDTRADMRADIRRALESALQPARGDGAVDRERVAQLTAHRACHSAEHDPENGRLHGYCIVCGIPWPCEYAGTPPSAAVGGRVGDDGESALWALRQILHDLPERRDWMDPDVEKVARGLVARNRYADLKSALAIAAAPEPQA